MFLPLHDKNPLKIVPYQIVTVAIIAICVAVYWWESSLSEQGLTEAAFTYGMVPAVLFNERTLPPELALFPAEVTLLTHMFIHGDWWHLLGNMLFLWVFGDNIEDSMGHFRFLLFFLLCGVIAALIHGVVEPQSAYPVIGASGAIAGIIGAYVLLHPKVKLLVLLFSRIPLYLPAYIIIGLWLVFQFVSIALGAESVAWWAHIGGFIAGMILIIPFRDKNIPLLDFGEVH